LAEKPVIAKLAVLLTSERRVGLGWPRRELSAGSGAVVMPVGDKLHPGRDPRSANQLLISAHAAVCSACCAAPFSIGQIMLDRSPIHRSTAPNGHASAAPRRSTPRLTLLATCWWLLAVDGYPGFSGTLDGGWR